MSGLTTVKVRFENPGDNLLLAAQPAHSSTPAVYSSPQADSTFTLPVFPGEEWRLVVLARGSEPSSQDVRDYQIVVTEVSLMGDKLATLPVSWLTAPRFAVQGDAIYVADLDAFEIYERQGDDILLRSKVTDAYGGSDVIVEGRYAYVGVQSKGLYVYDVSNLASPVMLGSVPFPIYVRPMAKIGDRLYIAHTNYGIEVVDVSDPTNPSWVDTIWVDGHDVVDGTSNGRLLIASDASEKQALFYSIDEQYRHTLLGTYQATQVFWDSAVHGRTKCRTDKAPPLPLRRSPRTLAKHQIHPVSSRRSAWSGASRPLVAIAGARARSDSAQKVRPLCEKSGEG